MNKKIVDVCENQVVIPSSLHVQSYENSMKYASFSAIIFALFFAKFAQKGQTPLCKKAYELEMYLIGTQGVKHTNARCICMLYNVS